VRKSRRENDGAIYWRNVSSVPKHAGVALVMSFEMMRLNRASSEPLYEQLYRQIREELESGSFDSSASRVPSSRVLAANSRDFETDCKPSVLKAACRRLSSNPETIRYFCRRPFTGNFSEGSHAGRRPRVASIPRASRGE
jgi:hypothetical protein